MVFDKNETVICVLNTYSDKNKTIPLSADSVTITIYDPDKNKVVNEELVTQSTTGVYEYDYTPTKSGIYEVEWKIIKGTRTTIKKDDFGVE